MSDSLVEYLHDHLAGSNFAMELLGFLCDKHAAEPLSDFVARLREEIRADQQVLKKLIDRVGGGTPVVKGAAAWLAQKLSELKLGRGQFGTFEALEMLAVGVLGKREMWLALAAIGAVDPRVQGLDFQQLASRAHDQYTRVEVFRLETARQAFTPSTVR